MARPDGEARERSCATRRERQQASGDAPRASPHSAGDEGGHPLPGIGLRAQQPRDIDAGAQHHSSTQSPCSGARPVPTDRRARQLTLQRRPVSSWTWLCASSSATRPAARPPTFMPRQEGAIRRSCVAGPSSCATSNSIGRPRGCGVSTMRCQNSPRRQREQQHKPTLHLPLPEHRQRLRHVLILVPRVGPAELTSRRVDADSRSTRRGRRPRRCSIARQLLHRAQHGTAASTLLLGGVVGRAVIAWKDPKPASDSARTLHRPSRPGPRGIAGSSHDPRQILLGTASRSTFAQSTSEHVLARIAQLPIVERTRWPLSRPRQRRDRFVATIDLNRFDHHAIGRRASTYPRGRDPG